jgi:pepF/M3 family oligoendopeptidase
MTTKPPHWDLTNVYPGLDSPELAAAFQSVSAQTSALDNLLRSVPGPEADLSALTQAVKALLLQLDQLWTLEFTVDSYINSFVSTDSYNQSALRLQSEFEQIQVRLQQQVLRAISWIGKIAARIPQIVASDETARLHTFFLQETARQSQYLMSPELEDLAAELTLSGANAWNKMRSLIISQVGVEFELDGQVKNLSLPALINLHSHPDEGVRRRAYEAEIKAEESVKQPIAAALNGVKGAVSTLDRRRGRPDALHSALDQARIDRATLDAMLAAMQASFPVFHRYFLAKARHLGKERLDWWDLFAPVGRSGLTFSFEQAKDFVLTHFASFSPELSSFARSAFEHNWIDAEQRRGKEAGAFCMDLPLVKESRILCNFDGTLDQVSTIAHELGHAFHAYCAYQQGKDVLQTVNPMTLAETASTLCETVISEAALALARDPQEELAILDTALIGASQIVVDIYSRFLFEKEVFERRAAAELSPDELCEIMLRAQKTAYGDAIHPDHFHPYMWTWKPHYYYPDLSFYNFPYAFGQLFATGLYAIFQQRGAEFIPQYKDLLASTGEASAADLAQRFDIDIRSRAFWEGSLALIARQIQRYEEI